MKITLLKFKFTIFSWISSVMTLLGCALLLPSCPPPLTQILSSLYLCLYLNWILCCPIDMTTKPDTFVLNYQLLCLKEDSCVLVAFTFYCQCVQFCDTSGKFVYWLKMCARFRKKKSEWRMQIVSKYLNSV